MERIETAKRILSTQLIVSFAALLAMLFIPVHSAFCAGTYACDFINKKEVEKIIGTGVSAAQAQASNPMGQNICVFDIPGSKGLGLVQILMLRTQWVKKLAKWD